ncbi:MAG: glycosyltransferase family 9 protein [Caulobacteraceae bacterium]|nr:glycosyltransferase family 9 protein [Caulobacter sp.]
MRRIRAAHPGAHVTLLTTPPYAALGRATGLFDAVDDGGRSQGLGAQLSLIGRLRRGRFDRVYDLQTSDRSSALRLAFWPRIPEWSGIAPGASHPHANPDRDRMHTLERQAEQLRDAGVWPDAPTARGAAPAPDLGFMPDDPTAPARFALAAPYALLAPGASPLRPGKRWPVERYAELARRLRAAGISPATVGGPGEAALGVALAQAGALDLTGRTGFDDLASLGRHAALAISNDTGPAHLLAAAGAPTVVLFGPDSDPALCAPRGARVRVLAADTLAAITPDAVWAELASLRAAPPEEIPA